MSQFSQVVCNHAFTFDALRERVSRFSSRNDGWLPQAVVAATLRRLEGAEAAALGIQPQSLTPTLLTTSCLTPWVIPPVLRALARAVPRSAPHSLDGFLRASRVVCRDYPGSLAGAG